MSETTRALAALPFEEKLKILVLLQELWKRLAIEYKLPYREPWYSKSNEES